MQIEHKTRTQLVVEVLREKILCGEISAGDPLRQAALAEEMNVSRIPVREALLQLEAEGLVCFEAHKGATVSEVSAKHVCEIFELRSILEPELLRHSIEKLTDEDIEYAKTALLKLEEAMNIGDTESATGKLNTVFHNCLYAKAERPQTAEIVASLNQSCSRYVRMHILLAGGLVTAPNEHRELLNLVAAKKTKQACSALEKHILSAKSDIKNLLLTKEKESNKSK